MIVTPGPSSDLPARVTRLAQGQVYLRDVCVYSVSVGYL